MQNLPAVGPAPRHMQPSIAVLVDKLVEIQVAPQEQIEEACIGRRTPRRDIGRLTQQMPGTNRTSDRRIQLRRAVTAVDRKGASP